MKRTQRINVFKLVLISMLIAVLILLSAVFAIRGFDNAEAEGMDSEITNMTYGENGYVTLENEFYVFPNEKECSVNFVSEKGAIKSFTYNTNGLDIIQANIVRFAKRCK